jgi:hypothetical protein
MQVQRDHGRPVSARRRRTRAELVQRRRFTLVVFLLALLVVITAVASRPGGQAAAASSSPVIATTTTLAPLPKPLSATYTAELAAAASGSAAAGTVAVLTLDYDSDTETVTYRLEVTASLPNPSIAAICQGGPGQSGATVFTLFPGPIVSGDFSGLLAKGTLDEEDMVGPLERSTLADLIALIQSGQTYATIGTRDCPIDAVRAQIH